MAKIKAAKCKCEFPCSCLIFEGKQYKGWESIVDELVEQRDDLLSYVDTLEKQLHLPEQ